MNFAGTKIIHRRESNEYKDRLEIVGPTNAVLQVVVSSTLCFSASSLLLHVNQRHTPRLQISRFSPVTKTISVLYKRLTFSFSFALLVAYRGESTTNTTDHVLLENNLSPPHLSGRLERSGLNAQLAVLEVRRLHGLKRIVL